MSIRAAALELNNSIDIFEFASKVRSVFKEIVISMNGAELLRKSIMEFDNHLLNKSAEDYAGNFMLAVRAVKSSITHEDPSISNIKLTFIQLDSRQFVLFDPSLRTLILSKLDELSDWVVGDYSFFNSTDDQLSSGELTQSEWDERSEFWLRNSRFSGIPKFVYSMLEANEYFPDWAELRKIAKEVSELKMHNRRKYIAKQILQDRMIKEASESPEETGNYYVLFDVINNLISNQYEGWEEIEKTLPKFSETRI